MEIVSNGVRLYVDDRGSGAPAVVFLHYWGGSSRTWRDVITALGGRYRTVAPDHRGWGRSGAPADSKYALADFANDAQQVIAALGLRRYVLVGHSMGGKIAQLVAARRPEGLAGLVLVAPSPPVPLALPPEARSMMENAYLSHASVEATIDHMLVAKPLTAARRLQIVEDSLCGAPEAKAAWPRAASQEDISGTVGAIDVPTLVIAGELDRVDSVPSLKANLLPYIPHARLDVLPGTGHLSPLESPDELAGLIHRFVDSLAPAVTVTLAMKLKPEHFDEFVRGLPGLTAQTATAPGARSVRVLRSDEDPHALVFLEEWSSAQAFSEYMAWRKDRGDLEQLNLVLAGPAQIRVCSELTLAEDTPGQEKLIADKRVGVEAARRVIACDRLRP